VQGPALLLRRNFAEKLSLSAGYYVDQISGASIDVVTSASPYHEERREISAGTDYLYRDTLMSLAYTDSNEHDYKARTYDFNVSQDMFENRSTLTLGFAQGNDQVGKVTDPGFHAKANRNHYSVALAQVINPTLVGVLSYAATADDGYLQNPYRHAYVQGGSVQEIYPGTRSGQALSLKLVKSWSPRWSARIDGRYYQDSWKIRAVNVGIGGSQYLFRDWILDESYRFYTQKAASFYSDNFQESLDYMARDKELAGFSSHTLGSKLTVPLFHGDPRQHSLLNNLSLSFAFDYMIVDYKDFTDRRPGQLSGFSLYGFDASIAQIFLTAKY
jgi:hypothetical protein